jgi:hypothetical protein
MSGTLSRALCEPRVVAFRELEAYLAVRDRRTPKAAHRLEGVLAWLPMLQLDIAPNLAEFAVRPARREHGVRARRHRPVWLEESMVWLTRRSVATRDTSPVR